ncbi:MAG: guanylate kinase [Fidelibacterota bacterium]
MKNLITISAPSGTGKTTLCRALQKKNPGLKFSISCTTRLKRDYEVDGFDYYFISREQFQEKIEAGEFAEYETVHGEYYGTLKASLREAVEQHTVLLLEVDVRGALSIKKLFPEQCLGIFILPPGIEDLKKRLHHRGTDSPERIKTRLQRFRMEMEYKDHFEYHVINDDVERAVQELLTIIQQETEGVKYVT